MTDAEKNAELRASFEKVGDVIRTLALAGVALVWLVSTESLRYGATTMESQWHLMAPYRPGILKDLVPQLALLIVALGWDLFEHVVRLRSVGPPSRSARVSLRFRAAIVAVAFIMLGWWTMHQSRFIVERGTPQYPYLPLSLQQKLGGAPLPPTKTPVPTKPPAPAALVAPHDANSRGLAGGARRFALRGRISAQRGEIS